MAFFGAGKRVLLVGGEGVALFGPTARGVERETALSWEVPNFDQQLTEALTEQNSGNPVLILFDGADQTYRKEENIPKLVFFDRVRFVKRKLEMAFPSYPVRTSMLVKPAKKKGRDAVQDQPFYLFVALPETDRLDKVSANILEAGVPIAGFGLLPAESVGLVAALSASVFKKEGKQSRWAVMIAQHETGGLRQVVVKDGNLALTRITPTSEAGVQGPAWVEEVMREFKATLTYIARFGYNAEEGLDVVVICGNIEKQFFNQKSLPVSNFQCLTTPEALTAIGSRGISLGENNFGDAIHAAWAARKRALAVPVTVPSIHRIMMPRLGARLGIIFLALSLLAGGGYVFSEWQDYVSLRGDVAHQRDQKSLKDSEYEQQSKVFDTLPIKPQDIKGALAVEKFVDSSGVNFTPMLNILRKVLDRDMKLDRLKFVHDAASAYTPSGADARPAPPPVPGSGEDRGVVRVSFRFTLPASITLEQKVARTEGLVKSLEAAFPGYGARIVSQFGNVSRTGMFSGEVGKTEGGGGQGQDFAEIEMTGAPL
jgi:hypothetical protein